MANFPARIQRNATDAKANRALERLEKRRLLVFSGALKALMATREGRFVVWHWLDRCMVWESIWAPNAEIHKNAGKQEFGQSIRADIITLVGYDAFALMEREAHEWQRGAMEEIEAALTRGATAPPQQE